MPIEPHAPTGGPRTALGRRVGRSAAAAFVVVVGLGLMTAAPAHAGLGDPLDPGGPTTTAADEPATTATPEETPTTAADAPTTTVADGEAPSTEGAGTAADGDTPAGVDEDDGTSVAALAAVGIGAFVLGLLVAGAPLVLALSKRKAAPAGSPQAPPSPAPAGPVAGPAIGAPPSRDADQVRGQRVALVEALIALRDKLPSEALAGEAASALAAAGISELAPVGRPFDPAQHKAVHQVSVDDPARHGTIAAVERPGYTDGHAIIRQPEVVVAVHGSPS